MGIASSLVTRKLRSRPRLKNEVMHEILLKKGSVGVVACLDGYPVTSRLRTLRNSCRERAGSRCGWADLAGCWRFIYSLPCLALLSPLLRGHSYRAMHTQ